MNKMREAFHNWLAQQDDLNKVQFLHCFEAGYQAAIAAVKEDGVAAWLHPNAELFPKKVLNSTPLYKLPEDWHDNEY